MGLYKSFDNDIEEVDIIIAGGGTAACVIAGRLTEADPGLSILVIEGGADNFNDPDIVTPAMCAKHLSPDSKTTMFYKAVRSQYLADRESIVPAGEVLGGGSSINFMMYTRAQREDYDSWKTPGWTTDELLPYLRKLETYDGPGDPALHGTSGPVRVSSGTYRTASFEDDFLRAAAAAGSREVENLQDLDFNDGFQRWRRFVSPGGRRSDAAHAYVHPRLRDGRHPNLHVLVESHVVRVLFEDDDDDDDDGQEASGGGGDGGGAVRTKRACGVEYTPNPRFQGPASSPQPQPRPRPKRTVRARRLVIVSCGACGSPLVLERSGIGGAAALARAGVPLVQDLPGVGHDYQDHQLMLYPFRMSLRPHETLDDLMSGRLSLAEARERRDPRLGWNSVDIAGKVRPTEDEVAGLGDAFGEAWARDYRDKPNRPLVIMAPIQMYVGPAEFGTEPGQYITMATCTTYPYSRGRLHITGPSLDDPLDFDVGYFGDPGAVDLAKHVWAYKKMREIVRRMRTYRGEVTGCHPPFAASSKAACVRLDMDDDGHGHDDDAQHNSNAAVAAAAAIEDIAYTAEDDGVIAQFLREKVNTTWHSLGTAKMAPRAELGVVDAGLGVYGVRGLKVADMSVAPENVGANTNSTALLIGEKAADIIIKELGLQG
ncbi:GMC oxidoreductase-domain-containing protein [Biscogniauxia marginata]|nr:GMC oxidoreductase-domain-containing protein [Biscogniauxia marginata]